jgi:predicted aconitase
MFITKEEQEILEGKMGPGMQRATELLVNLGKAHDARCLVRASYGHAPQYDVIPEDFWEVITKGAKPVMKVTTHPSYQPELWKEWGIAGAGIDAIIDEHQRKLAKVRQLGWLLTDTCAEYLLGIIPRKGDVVAMHGTCMQVANNSLFGARVDRAGIFCALASCITGKVPLMGLMLPENRHAHIVFQLEGLDVTNWTTTHYSCLGYYMGMQVTGQKNIAVVGLPPDLPLDLARALVMPLPTSGSVTLCHIVGTTPEAPTLEAALGNKTPEQTITVGKRQMKETWQSLTRCKDNVVEHVAFGCPHCTIDEIAEVAALVAGKNLKAPLLIGASVPVEALARKQGFADIIERAGGRFLSCCPSISNPFARADFAGGNQVKSAAVDSARAAYYVAGVCRVDTFFGTRAQCITAALTGKWQGSEYED